MYEDKLSIDRRSFLHIKVRSHKNSLGGISMKKTTATMNAENLFVCEKVNIMFADEVRTVFICECGSYDMVTDAGTKLHTCMEALIADADDILIPCEMVNGEPVAHARVMRGDIVCMASQKFIRDFWLKFDAKKQVMMIYLIIARTAALATGITCMTEMYDKVMIFMNDFINADSECKYSRAKVISALKKINSYEERFCKKYLKDLSKNNIGVTAAADNFDFGDYDDCDDFDNDDCECCCG